MLDINVPSTYCICSVAFHSIIKNDVDSDNSFILFLTLDVLDVIANEFTNKYYL